MLTNQATLSSVLDRYGSPSGIALSDRFIRALEYFVDWPLRARIPADRVYFSPAPLEDGATTASVLMHFDFVEYMLSFKNPNTGGVVIVRAYSANDLARTLLDVAIPDGDRTADRVERALLELMEVIDGITISDIGLVLEPELTATAGNSEIIIHKPDVTLFGTQLMRAVSKARINEEVRVLVEM